MKTIFLIVILLLALLSACNENVARGPGSETVAVAGQAFYQDGSKAAGCDVVLRRSDYLASLPGQKSADLKIQTTTDNSGQFRIDSIKAGDYVIEINNNSSKAARLTCLVNTENDLILPADTLKPTSSISGLCILPEGFNGKLYIQIYGLERLFEINPENDGYTVSGIPAGVYDLRIAAIALDSLFSRLSEIKVLSDAPANAGIMDMRSQNSYTYSSIINLNTTSTGADITEDVINFPVLVRLNESNFDFSKANADGGDIRFFQNNKPLPYEIERWDFSAKNAAIWVKLDTIYGNSSNQSVVIAWGNSSLKTASKGSLVFDSAFSFEAVWHLSGNDPILIPESSPNNFETKAENTRDTFQVEGIIAEAKYFNGETTYLSVPESSDGILDFSETDSFSVSAWVYFDSIDGEYHHILSKGNHQYGLHLDSSGYFEFFYFEDGTGWKKVRAQAVEKEWTLVSGVKRGPALQLFINGVLASEEVLTVPDPYRLDTGHDFFIGRQADIAYSFWKGRIDEVRVSSIPRSSSWIKLEYMSQKFQNTLTEF